MNERFGDASEAVDFESHKAGPGAIPPVLVHKRQH